MAQVFAFVSKQNCGVQATTKQIDECGEVATAPLELVKKPCDLAKSFECNVITKTMAILQLGSSHGI